MADVKGFIRAHKLKKSTALLATNDALLAYRDPTLPAIYIADKHGWLVTRMLGTKEKSLDPAEVRKILDHLILK